MVNVEGIEPTRDGKTKIDPVPTLIVLALLAIVAAIVVPNLLASRKRQNERAAIGALKSIATSQSVFREGDKDGNGVLDYGSLAQLSHAQLIDAVLGSGTKYGYLFRVGASTSTSEFLWFATAEPIEPGVTGDRYFEANQQAVIYSTTSAPYALNTTTCAIDTDPRALPSK